MCRKKKCRKSYLVLRVLPRPYVDHMIPSIPRSCCCFPTKTKVIFVFRLSAPTHPFGRETFLSKIKTKNTKKRDRVYEIGARRSGGASPPPPADSQWCDRSEAGEMKQIPTKKSLFCIVSTQCGKQSTKMHKQREWEKVRKRGREAERAIDRERWRDSEMER